MSNKSRLQTNNENLQSLIDKANQLPDAGGGGAAGGACDFSVTLLDRESSVLPAYCTISYLDETSSPNMYIINMATTTSTLTATISARINSLVVVSVPGAAINNVMQTAISITGDCITATKGISGIALFPSAIPFLVNGSSSVSITIN